MTGNRALLDTNVIILISKGKIDIASLLAIYDDFFASIITYMEVYGYDFPNPNEKVVIDGFFANIEVVNLDMPIAELVIQYKTTQRKKIKLPDAIILATARHLGADLLSDDWDDFEHIDPNVVVKDLSFIKK